MKKVLCSFPLLVLFFSLILIQSGCNKSDDVVTPVDENVDKQTVSAKNTSELVKLVTGANSVAWQYQNLVPSGSCPEYYYDSLFFTALVVDYGAFPGCTGSDNEKRSGSLLLTTNVFSGGDSMYTTIGFVDYRVYKYPVNTDTNIIKVHGNLNVSIKKISGTTYSFRSGGEALFTTLEGDNKTITLNGFAGTVNFNSLNTADDDVYSIYGSLKIVDSELGVTYDISVNSSSALKINGNCRYPISGIANIGGASCDFSPESSSCDAIAKFTKGSTVKTVDFTNIDF